MTKDNLESVKDNVNALRAAVIMHPDATAQQRRVADTVFNQLNTQTLDQATNSVARLMNAVSNLKLDQPEEVEAISMADGIKNLKEQLPNLETRMGQVEEEVTTFEAPTPPPSVIESEQEEVQQEEKVEAGPKIRFDDIPAIRAALEPIIAQKAVNEMFPTEGSGPDATGYKSLFSELGSESQATLKSKIEAIIDSLPEEQKFGEDGFEPQIEALESYLGPLKINRGEEQKQAEIETPEAEQEEVQVEEQAAAIDVTPEAEQAETQDEEKPNLPSENDLIRKINRVAQQVKDEVQPDGKLASKLSEFDQDRNLVREGKIEQVAPKYAATERELVIQHKQGLEPRQVAMDARQKANFKEQQRATLKNEGLSVLDAVFKTSRLKDAAKRAEEKTRVAMNLPLEVKEKFSVKAMWEGAKATFNAVSSQIANVYQGIKERLGLGGAPPPNSTPTEPQQQTATQPEPRSMDYSELGAKGEEQDTEEVSMNYADFGSDGEESESEELKAMDYGNDSESQEAESAWSSIVEHQAQSPSSRQKARSSVETLKTDSPKEDTKVEEEAQEVEVEEARSSRVP